MKCPVCSNEMTEKDFGGVLVDVCEAGCKGLWFDWLELTKLDETNEGVGGALEEALKSPRHNDSNREQIKCPKCGVPMHNHKYQSAKEVNVDECYACGGFFLDSGELPIIRDTFMTEEEREAYTQKLIAEIPEFEEAEKNLEKIQLRIRVIKQFTKYLRFRRLI